MPEPGARNLGPAPVAPPRRDNQGKWLSSCQAFIGEQLLIGGQNFAHHGLGGEVTDNPLTAGFSGSAPGFATCGGGAETMGVTRS